MTEPTPWQKVGYYALGLTPPAVSREWVERDIDTTGWQVRRLLQIWIGTVIGLAIIGPIVVGMSLEVWKGQLAALMAGALIGGIIVGVLQATVLADYIRRRTLSYYRKKWDTQLSV